MQRVNQSRRKHLTVKVQDGRDGAPAGKRVRASPLEKLETLLEAWFIARRANKLIITHDLLVE